MKTWKLVAGIFSILFSVFIFFQSQFANVAEVLGQTGTTNGGAGIIVALLLLGAGIVSIATRTSGKPGNIACLIIFGIAGIIAVNNAQIYKDLMVWGIWCFLCAFIALIASFRKSK